MLVVEFCEMCQIEGTEMTCRYDNPSKSVVVTWEFPVPNHPTVTHGSLSKTFSSSMLKSEEAVKITVDQARQQIEQYLK